LNLSGTTHREIASYYVSPLVLDLDQDGLVDVNGGDWAPHAGFHTAGPTALFDIDGDGHRDRCEWLGPDDALIVAPESPGKVVSTGNGLVWNGPVSGRDLLGSAGGYANGFQKLLERFDANHDGQVSGSELQTLHAWRDLDGDGTIDAGELQSLEQLGVTVLSPPGNGSCVGSAVLPSGPRLVWDWWPSYSMVNPVSGAATPPVTLPITGQPASDHVLLAPLVSPDANGLLSRSVLMGLGVQWASARIAGVSPDGARILLTDQTADPAERAAGRVKRLIVLSLSGLGNDLRPLIVSLPVSEVLQFAFSGSDLGWVLADGGTRLLKVDLTTGGVSEYIVPAEAPGRFRGTFFARSGDGFAHFSGHFLDPAGFAGPEMLVRIVEGPGVTQLVGMANLDAALQLARAHGPVVGELPDNPNRMYFVTRDSIGGGGKLLMVSGSTVTVMDDHVSPIGMAVSGDRILYFREGNAPGIREAWVRDAVSGTAHHLGDGDYSYPYLMAYGQRALVTTTDWSNGTMQLLGAAVGDQAIFSTALSGGFGAVRVSESGNLIASLAPEGLWLSRTATVSVPSGANLPRLPLRLSPNPFAGRTTLRYTLSEARRVRVDVLSLDGRRIVRLADQFQAAGTHEIEWDGADARGRRLPPGAYLVRVDDGRFPSGGTSILLR
jgi:hypothetical protein